MCEIITFESNNIKKFFCFDLDTSLIHTRDLVLESQETSHIFKFMI